MYHAPNEICWNADAASFIDELVDIDIGYLDVQLAIEQIVHAGLLSALSVSFIHEGSNFFFHRVPKLAPHLHEIDVFTTMDQAGKITVEIVCFA